MAWERPSTSPVRIPTQPLPDYPIVEVPLRKGQKAPDLSTLPDGRLPSTYPAAFPGSNSEHKAGSEDAAPWAFFTPDSLGKSSDAAKALPPNVSLRRPPSQAALKRSGGRAYRKKHWRPFPAADEGNGLRRPYTAPSAEYTNHVGDEEMYTPAEGEQVDYKDAYKKTGSHVVARSVVDVLARMRSEGGSRHADEHTVGMEVFRHSVLRGRVFGSAGRPTMSNPIHRRAQLPTPSGADDTRTRAKLPSRAHDHNDDTFRKGVCQSFRTNALELTFKGLTRVSRLMCSTLVLQINHLTERTCLI